MIFITNRTGGEFYNTSDLERVEQNVQDLSDSLNSYGYDTDVDTVTSWLETEFFTLESNDQRYIGNLEEFKTKFTALQAIPSTMVKLGYVNANNIEKLLEEVYNNIINMVFDFNYSGEIFSGEDGLL